MSDTAPNDAPTPNDTTNDAVVDPVLYEPPTVTIAGRHYQLRRLGVRDVFQVARIISRGLTDLTRAGTVDATGATLVPLLLGALVDEEKAVMDFLAGIIGVTAKELGDPEKFPLDAIFTVIDALAEHEDLKAFFAKSTALTAKMMQARGTRPTP